MGIISTIAAWLWLHTHRHHECSRDDPAQSTTTAQSKRSLGGVVFIVCALLLVSLFVIAALDDAILYIAINK